jgi:hypothetical protein
MENGKMGTVVEVQLEFDMSAFAITENKNKEKEF